MMTPITHIYLFRSILNHHNEEINKTFLKRFENELPFPISFDQFGPIIYDVPSINTKSFINAENDECLKKETIYQTEDESMEESQSDYENNISISTFIEEETEDSNTEMEICIKDTEDLKIATRQASKVNSERLIPPDDDDVWTHCPNFTFRERSSITSGKPLTDEIMHKVMLKLLYGYNGFIIAGFNKMLYRKHTFQNIYKRQNRPFIQIHKLYENNWVVIIDFCHISEIDSDEALSTIYIYDSFLKKSYRKKTNEVRYLLTFIQDACDLMSRPYKTVEFVVVDVSQVSGVELSGFYSIVFAYHILNGVGMQTLHINEEKIFDVTCVFLERGTFPEDTSIYKVSRRAFLSLFSAQRWQNETMRPMSELVT